MAAHSDRDTHRDTRSFVNKKVLNALTFKFGWVACLAGGSVVALLVALAFFAIHFRFVAPRREIILVLIVVAIGLVVDSIWLRIGLLVDPGGSLLPPLWLICVWAIFAATLSHCLSWFQNRLPLAALLGAVVGPLSYLAGGKLSDYSISEPLISQAIKLGVGWAIVFPLVLFIAKKLDANKS